MWTLSEIQFSQTSGRICCTLFHVHSGTSLCRFIVYPRDGNVVQHHSVRLLCPLALLNMSRATWKLRFVPSPLHTALSTFGKRLPRNLIARCRLTFRFFIIVKGSRYSRSRDRNLSYARKLMTFLIRGDIVAETWSQSTNKRTARRKRDFARTRRRDERKRWRKLNLGLHFVVQN